MAFTAQDPSGVVAILGKLGNTFAFTLLSGQSLYSDCDRCCDVDTKRVPKED